MNDFLLLMSFSGFILGAVTCSILWFSNKSQRYANAMLSISLFAIAIGLLVTFLHEWNINYYAVIYRLPSPLYYMIMPSAFLYVRAITNNETALKRKDLLHFVPSLLHLLEMAPFYFSGFDYRKKIAMVASTEIGNPLKLSEGLLPPYCHLIIISVSGLIYLGLMMIAIRKSRKNKRVTFLISHALPYRWITMFTTLMTLISIPIIYLLASLSQTDFIYGVQLLLFTLCGSFFAINIYLLFQPEVLYGIQSGSPAMNSSMCSDEADDLLVYEVVSQNKNEPQKANDVLSFLENYKPVLESFISCNKPFLKQGYSINDLSLDTGIPLHHLSGLINRLYGKRFNDYLNGMRINFIIENHNALHWGNLTLEGIAKQAGFNSRTTFFNSIKKTTGLTPSDFIASIRNPQTHKKD